VVPIQNEDILKRNSNNRESYSNEIKNNI